MQANHVCLRQERVKRGGGFRVAERQTRLDIVENHAHAEVFREYRQLRADIAVADNAERFAARLAGAFGILWPLPAMHRLIACHQAAQQADDFCQYQFGDRARVGIGGVKHRNAKQLCRLQRHLIGADTKAADRFQMRRRLQHLGGELGARADADHVCILQGFRQRRAFQRRRTQLNAGKPRLFQRGNRVRVDAFKQQNARIVIQHVQLSIFH